MELFVRNSRKSLYMYVYQGKHYYNQGNEQIHHTTKKFL